MIKLISSNDPLFKQPIEKFDFDNPQYDPDELVDNMVKTMCQAKGIGLSAIQVGIPVSVFVMGHYNMPDEVLAVFNPRIVDYSGEEVFEEEGCLTFPGLFIKIKRYSHIRIRFADKFGNVNTHVMDGIPARIAQHEFDHCQGIQYQQRASTLHLQRAKKQKEKLDRLRKRNARV